MQAAGSVKSDYVGTTTIHFGKDLQATFSVEWLQLMELMTGIDLRKSALSVTVNYDQNGKLFVLTRLDDRT